MSLVTRSAFRECLRGPSTRHWLFTTCQSLRDWGRICKALLVASFRPCFLVFFYWAGLSFGRFCNLIYTYLYVSFCLHMSVYLSIYIYLNIYMLLKSCFTHSFLCYSVFFSIFISTHNLVFSLLRFISSQKCQFYSLWVYICNIRIGLHLQ